MNAETSLKRLQDELTPRSSRQARLKKQLMGQIAVPAALSEAREALQSSAQHKQQLWARVLQRITATSAHSLLSQLAGLLSPVAQKRRTLWQRILQQLDDFTASPALFGRAKWVASFAMAVFVIQLSPAFFLAPTTTADSQVLAISTGGEAAVYSDGQWYDLTDEIVVESKMRFRGAVSILYPNAVVRLDEDALVEVYDVFNTSEAVATLGLVSGRIWAQGLTPVGGITIATTHGLVTVREGSVSIEDQDEAVEVAVWDRRALVGNNQTLLTGDRIHLRANNKLLIKKIPEAEFASEWVKNNLAMDAVHQRTIAHLQHERLARDAGILPTSNLLYPVKLAAEQVDLFFTFDNNVQQEKRIQLAQTRLNEAAALVLEGADVQEVLLQIEEFKHSLQAVAAEGNDTNVVLSQALTEAMAHVSASLPGDESYVLKKALLEAVATLPSEVANKTDVETILLLDTLTVLTDQVEAGSLQNVAMTWADVQAHVSLLENETVNEDLRREGRSYLSRLALAVEEQVALQPSALSEPVRDSILAFSPPKRGPVAAQLSEQEVQEMVQGMLEDVYTFKMPRSRENEVRLKVAELRGHEAEGRLLRALDRSLPERSFLRKHVQREIVRLRWDKAYAGDGVDGAGEGV